MELREDTSLLKRLVIKQDIQITHLNKEVGDLHTLARLVRSSVMLYNIPDGSKEEDCEKSVREALKELILKKQINFEIPAFGDLT